MTRAPAARARVYGVWCRRRIVRSVPDGIVPSWCARRNDTGRLCRRGERQSRLTGPKFSLLAREDAPLRGAAISPRVALLNAPKNWGAGFASLASFTDTRVAVGLKGLLWGRPQGVRCGHPLDAMPRYVRKISLTHYGLSDAINRITDTSERA
jgi:hypothetical protein